MPSDAWARSWRRRFVTRLQRPPRQARAVAMPRAWRHKSSLRETSGGALLSLGTRVPTTRRTSCAMALKPITIAHRQSTYSSQLPPELWSVVARPCSKQSYLEGSKVRLEGCCPVASFVCAACACVHAFLFQVYSCRRVGVQWIVRGASCVCAVWLWRVGSCGIGSGLLSAFPSGEVYMRMGLRACAAYQI